MFSSKASDSPGATRRRAAASTVGGPSAPTAIARSASERDAYFQRGGPSPLKPGAAFILSTPFAHPLSCLLDPAWYVGHRHYGRMQLGGLLAEAGFEIDRCFVYGAFWDILTTDLFYVFKFAFGAEVPLHDLLEAQRRREFVGERAVEGISNIFVTAHKPSQLTGVARP